MKDTQRELPFNRSVLLRPSLLLSGRRNGGPATAMNPQYDPGRWLAFAAMHSLEEEKAALAL